MGMNPQNLYEFLDSRAAGEFLVSYIQSNDIMLFKGSQGMRIERAVAMIMLEKDSREKLLVRQDAEWLRKE